MRMLKPTNIGNFVRGIDMLSDITSLPRGAVRDGVNVDFDVAGGVRSRAGFAPALSLPGTHSLWGSADGSFGLVAQDDKLRRVIVQDGEPLSAIVLQGLTRSERMSYFEHGGAVFFTNGHQLGSITRTTAMLLGLPVPPAPALARTAVGVLPAGRYSAAVSYVAQSGEESGLSEMTDIELPAAGGLALGTQPVAGLGLRVYLTPLNGDVLYQAAELAAGAGSVILGSYQPGKAADNQFLRPMPAGATVRAHNGRIVVARGRTHTFSRPFRYALTDPRTDLVQFDADVVLVEPVRHGLFVGIATGQVYFLAGGGPSDFSQALVSVTPVVPWASTTMPATHLEPDLAKKAGAPVAVWLGRAGYVVGMPDGSVLDMQADRIALPASSSGLAVATVRQGIKQSLSIVESSATAGLGLAVDPEI
jgi:hypothetical protein